MSSLLSPRTLALALAHPRLRPHPTHILTCAHPHPRIPLALPIIIPGPVMRVWVISGTGMGHHPGSQGLPVMNPTCTITCSFACSCSCLLLSVLITHTIICSLTCSHPFSPLATSFAHHLLCPYSSCFAHAVHPLSFLHNPSLRPFCFGLGALLAPLLHILSLRLSLCLSCFACSMFSASYIMFLYYSRELNTNMMSSNLNMTRYDENKAPTYVSYPVTSGKIVSYELG